MISVNHYEGGKTESMDLEKAYDKIYRYTYFKLNDQAVAEDIVMVREALSHLSVEDQELLLLRHVNKESVGTISNALGISRFALYRRLKAAENELRMRLEVEKNEG